MKECYLISKYTHSSYTDLMDITPTERDYLIELIQDELNKSKEAVEKAKAEAKSKRKR